jgi:transglutaminase-like putative cysteine protease
LKEKMEATNRLSDFENPLVQSKAMELTQGKETLVEKLESIFYYVRDGIKFGFPPRWDIVKASETVTTLPAKAGEHLGKRSLQ